MSVALLRKRCCCVIAGVCPPSLVECEQCITGQQITGTLELRFFREGVFDVTCEATHTYTVTQATFFAQSCALLAPLDDRTGPHVLCGEPFGQGELAVRAIPGGTNCSDDNYRMGGAIQGGSYFPASGVFSPFGEAVVLSDSLPFLDLDPNGCPLPGTSIWDGQQYSWSSFDGLTNGELLSASFSLG